MNVLTVPPMANIKYMNLQFCHMKDMCIGYPLTEFMVHIYKIGGAVSISVSANRYCVPPNSTLIFMYIFKRSENGI